MLRGENARKHDNDYPDAHGGIFMTLVAVSRGSNFFPILLVCPYSAYVTLYS